MIGIRVVLGRPVHSHLGHAQEGRLGAASACARVGRQRLELEHQGRLLDGVGLGRWLVQHLGLAHVLVRELGTAIVDDWVS